MRLFYLLILFFPFLALSQNGMPAIEESDPEAIKILEKIQTDYNAHKSHRIDFEFLIEYPGEPNQVQKGQLIQSGEKFELELDDKLIISDNVTVWLYAKGSNEVQINDADFGEDGEYLSPNKIFNLYKSDEFIFAINQHTYENGKAVTLIECKPLDKDSDYSKMRLTVEDAGHKVKSFKMFSKDGSRFTMSILGHSTDQKIKSGAFTFDVKNYPGVIVEDLRF